jgi:hypothetical protein
MKRTDIPKFKPYFDLEVRGEPITTTKPTISSQQIYNGAVTIVKLANIASKLMLGRNSTGVGAVEALTAAIVMSILSGQADATFSFNSEAVEDVDELTLVPKASSTGAEGTIFYSSDDKHIYVGVDL